MGRSPCCSKEGLNRGTWTAREDMILCQYIKTHGVREWRNFPFKAGLKRCGKSCRLRWRNYLNPDIKRGNFSSDEVETIIKIHRLLGNRWSLIAGRLPGRTDDEIKNYWNTHPSKKLTINDYEPDIIHNNKTRSRSLSLVQNHACKTTPVKSTVVSHSDVLIRENGWNGDPNDGKPHECFKLSDFEKNKNTCELFVEDSITEKDSKFNIALTVEDISLIEIEVRNSTCSMWNLADEQFPHHLQFAGEVPTIDESLLDLNDISFPHCDLLSCPSNFLADFSS